MRLIEASEDYYGSPDIGMRFINPEHIIEMIYIPEYTDRYNYKHESHYRIEVSFGKMSKTFHISLEDGNSLIKQGEPR